MNKLKTINELKNIYREYRMPVEGVNLTGCRDSSGMKDDIFNDKIILWNKVDIEVFEATTDPGVYYTKHPLNSRGCAHLLLGPWLKLWRFGLHRGKYEALVQHSAATVWRDYNKNMEEDIAEQMMHETDIIGLNLHTDFGADDLIERASASCQVIKNKDRYFQEFIPYIKSHMQPTFSYLLVDKSEFWV